MQVQVATFFSNSYAYALFPTIGKGGIGIGGAHGKGRVFQGGRHIGDTSMTQVTIGFQLGGQAYSMIIFFEDERALREFTSGNFEFGAQATAVAITAGASASASTAGGGTAGASGGQNDATTSGGYTKGMAVFTIAKGGLMYEASLGGQKFSYTPRWRNSRRTSVIQSMSPALFRLGHIASIPGRAHGEFVDAYVRRQRRQKSNDFAAVLGLNHLCLVRIRHRNRSIVQNRSCDFSRADGTRADTVHAGFHIEAFGHRVHRVLGCRVGRTGHDADEATGPGRDVDDQSIALLDHFRQHGFASSKKRRRDRPGSPCPSHPG